MHLPSLDSQKSLLNKKFWHVKSQKIMSKIKFKIFSGSQKLDSHKYIFECFVENFVLSHLFSSLFND